MKKILFLSILIIIMSICGCSIKEENMIDININQSYNSDICINQNEIYYVGLDNSIPTIYKYDTDNNVTSNLLSSESSVGIYCLDFFDGNLYYWEIHENNEISLNKFQDGNIQLISKHKYEKDLPYHLLLTNANDAVFFSDGTNLYSIENDKVETIKSNIDYAYIDESGIYYSKDKQLYKYHFDSKNDEKILSVSELLESEAYMERVSLAEDYANIYNITQYNNEIYFIIKDTGSEYGNLYKLNYSTKDIQLVDNNLYKDYRIYENFIWGNGKCVIGDELKTGLFYVDSKSDELTHIYDGNIYSFCVDINSQKIYFSEESINNHSIKMVDLKTLNSNTIKSFL